MSDVFGDLDDDDVWGTEPADPEQVARKLHELRRSRGFEDYEWDELTPAAKLVLIAVLSDLLDWGRRQGVFR